MSGATLAIVTAPTDAAAVKLYVGESEHTRRLGIAANDLRHGGYRIVSGDHWLVLLGRDNQWQPTGIMKLAANRYMWDGRYLREDKPLAKAWDRVSSGFWGLPFRPLKKRYSDELDLWEFDERGSYNAVVGFLRRQGVRWYMPGELGEVVPEQTSIALPDVDETVRPDFPIRRPYFYARRFSQYGEGDYLKWQMRLGVNQAADLMGAGYRAHGIAHVIDREPMRINHPEYYALVNGRRATGLEDRDARRECLSSLGLVEANAQFCRDMFNVFDMPMVSVMPLDGFTSTCKCRYCKDEPQPERGWNGQFSNYVWSYTEQVARRVYRTHPDRKLLAMSYSTYLDAPTNVDKLPPNVMISIAQHRTKFRQNQSYHDRHVKLREQWLDLLTVPGHKLIMYDYYLYSRPGKRYEFTPAFSPRAIAADYQSLKGLSLGDYMEVDTDFRTDELRARAITGLNMYITSQYWWDADQDIDALLDEYYTRFFGPAAEPMRAFIEYSENNWMDLEKVEKIDKVFELMAAAQDAAPEGSVYAKRIKTIADYIDPLKDRRERLSQPRDNIPRATMVTRNDSQVTIDGKLDDEAWQNMRTYRLRDLKTGAYTDIRSYFHIFWKNGALYVGIRCKEPDMAGLNPASDVDDDTSIWGGDEVEVLIETQVHSYYQLCIAPSGALLDVSFDNGYKTSWSSDAEVGVHHGEDEWTVEVRIPVASEDQKNIDPMNGVAGRKPSNAYPWYFNICRQRVRGDERRHWAFSPTGGGFQKPRKFGKLGQILRDRERRAEWKKQKQQWLDQWE